MATFLLLVLALFGTTFGDDLCPDEKEFFPCTCDGEGVNCMNVKTVEELRKSFQAKFKYGSARAVWVQGTPLKTLPADVFGTVQSESFYVELNALESVDLNAFRAVKKTVSLLSFFGNQLVDFPWKQVSEFERLGTLNLGRNKIETIPSNAINSRSLWSLILAHNQIKNIEPNAFENMPTLGRIELSLNQLSSLGPMSLSMKQHSHDLQINLNSNKLEQIDPQAFGETNPFGVLFAQNKLTSLKKEPFEKLVTQVAQKGGYLEVSSNPFSCKGCDYSWIAVNKDALAQKLNGFRCADGKTIHDLTKSSIQCN